MQPVDGTLQIPPVRVTVVVKECFTLPNIPEEELHHTIKFSVIHGTSPYEGLTLLQGMLIVCSKPHLRANFLLVHGAF